MHLQPKIYLFYFIFDQFWTISKFGQIETSRFQNCDHYPSLAHIQYLEEQLLNFSPTCDTLDTLI